MVRCQMSDRLRNVDELDYYDLLITPRTVGWKRTNGSGLLTLIHLTGFGVSSLERASTRWRLEMRNVTAENWRSHESTGRAKKGLSPKLSPMRHFTLMYLSIFLCLSLLFLF